MDVVVLNAKKMNKIAVIIPFYKRHEITSLFFEDIKEKAEKFGFDVYTAGSDGETSKRLAESFGFNYIETPNNPVSSKLNTLIQETKHGNYDGVLLLGSDNFITDELLLKYSKIDLKKSVMYGVKNLYFYRVSDRKTGVDGQYIHNSISVGAGRLFSVKLLQEISYTPWNKTANNGLDTICSTRIGKKEKIIKCKNGYVLDVKHEENITSHRIVDSCKIVDFSELSIFGEIVEKISSLVDNGNRKTIPRNKTNLSLKVEFIEDSIYFEKGTVKKLPIAIARTLVRSGKAKEIINT